jgi:hypothetical protein
MGYQKKRNSTYTLLTRSPVDPTLLLSQCAESL